MREYMYLELGQKKAAPSADDYAVLGFEPNTPLSYQQVRSGCVGGSGGVSLLAPSFRAYLSPCLTRATRQLLARTRTLIDAIDPPIRATSERYARICAAYDRIRGPPKCVVLFNFFFFGMSLAFRN